MEILVLSHEDVEKLMPMRDCIDVMAEVLETLERGDAHNPLRSVVKPPNTGHFLGLMPAYRGGDHPAYCLKEVCIFPENPKRGLDAHQGSVLLHSAETGELIAVMNGSAITAIRTAAVSAVATKLLAREDAKELAIVGTGVQGRSHLDAMAALDRFERVRVVGRRPDSARAFAEELGPKYSLSIEPADNVQKAVEGADVIVTATNSSEPVLKREWIAPGAHINAVGSSVRYARELDTAAVVRSRLFVDRKESTINEAGDFLFPKKEGAVDDDHIVGEIGDILLGKIGGRRTPDEITLFESLGLAVEDLAASYYVYHRALKEGSGTPVDLGGLAHAPT